MLVDLRREQAAGERPVDRQTTVGALLIAWLRERHGRVSATSWYRYESQVRLGLAGLAGTKATALTADDVRRHLQSLTPAAGRSALRILRAALTLAVRDGTLERNVAEGVAPPKRAPSPGVALTGVEVAHLLDVTRGEPLYPLWAVLLGTGLRMGEALGLRWTDVDTVGRRVTVTGSLRHQDARYRGTGPRLARQEPKTAAGRRSVPLAGYGARALDAMPRDAVYVFHRGHGRPLNPSTVQRAFADAVARAKLPAMRLHDTRHTCATLWLAAGMSLDDVKRALGHASIQVTSDVYGHLVADRQRQLADALDEAVG